jgi:hypothetical protein
MHLPRRARDLIERFRAAEPQPVRPASALRRLLSVTNAALAISSFTVTPFSAASTSMP